MIYISGKITGNKNYKEHFKKAQEYWESTGEAVINPTEISLPKNFNTWADYMIICLNLLKNADSIYMLNNHKDSKGALIELEFARAMGIEVFYE